MPLTVKSPHSGKPVKVRDQDVGRALRDEAGRVFYVLPRASGEGYYAATTRAGSVREEQRYDEMTEAPATAGIDASNVSAAPPGDSSTPVHDATGRRRRRKTGRVGGLAAAAVVVAVAGLGWAWWQGYLNPWLPEAWRGPATTVPAEPQTVDSPPPAQTGLGSTP